MKFRTRPTIVEAVQWDPGTAVANCVVYCDHAGPNKGRPYVLTVYNERLYLAAGDWLLPDPDGRSASRLRPDVFAAAYEPAETPEPTPAWRPLASAPRDGSVLIGALIRDGRVWRVHEMRHNGLAFYSLAGLALPQMTHWLPVPPAPPAEKAPRG